MATVLIPTSTAILHYEQQTLIEGRTYTLSFNWNEREDSWYMDVMAEDGTELRMGIKIVIGWPLASHVVDPALPPGTFITVSLTDSEDEATVSELGSRVVLTYTDSADVEAL